MGSPTNQDLENRIHEMAKQLAGLEAKQEIHADLAKEERQAVRQKIDAVYRRVDAVDQKVDSKTQEILEKVDRVDDTITGFVNRVEGGRVVVRLGWKVGGGFLAIIGAVAGYFTDIVPKLFALLAR